jgi:predicted permease
MDLLLQDFRYALRRLRQTPGFASIAVAIMALGIGANTAIFSIVNAVLFRPQPFENPEELVEIYTTGRNSEIGATSSYPDYLDFREQKDLFADVLTYRLGMVNHTTEGASKLLLVEYVTASYFSVLGLRPLLGRAFDPASEGQIGAIEPVAIVSHATWQRRFGGDPSIVGKTVRLNGRAVTVVGVGPEGYGGSWVGLNVDFWLPVAAGPLVESLGEGMISDNLYERRGVHMFFVKARLIPGVTVEAARAGMDVLAGRLAREYPETNEGRKIQVFASKDVRFVPIVDRALTPVAGLLMAVVGLVLVIACSNLANLLLARASAGQKEVAIRLAIGANRGQLVRQFMAESVLLAVLGGGAGLLLAYWIVNLIMAFEPPLPIPVAFDFGLDERVLGFTVILSVLTGVLFGLAPSLKGSRPNLIPTLKDDAPTMGQGGRRFGLRNLLVVSQVAVSLLLLVGAGLFVRSLANVQRIDPGFETKNAAIVATAVDVAGYSEQEGREFYRQFARRLEALPGVLSVALADKVPVGAGISTRDVYIEGYELPPGQDDLEVDNGVVSPSYFETLDVPILRGRGFDERDGEAAPRVAVVSETMARRYWGSGDVIGRSFRLRGLDGPRVEIVGVARDTKVRTLGEDPRPYFYLAFGQTYQALAYFIIRTAGDPTRMPETVRQELVAVDPDIPLFEAKTMSDHLGLMLFAPRMGAALLSAFALLAMVLASLGLYGVVAYAVSRRTREVGIRVALGANQGQVVRMVVREGMTLVAVGLGSGLALAVVATRPMSNWLYGIGAGDPMTFGVVGALLASVAFLASYVPARRAAKVDPMVALRYE